MRSVSSLLPVILAGCATTMTATETPAPTGRGPITAVEPTPATKLDQWKSRPADAACQTGLTAFAKGELDAFNGLARCGRIDAEFAFGPSGDQPSKFEQFGEYRVYRHAGSGSSVFVWFLSDDIRVAQLLYPKLQRSIKDLLGEPEAKVRSELSPEWDQWIYAGRGLTAHVKRATGEVITLFAYRPSTVEAFLKTDIARVAKSEAPLEELK
jgi:hypothetical protein